MAKPESKLETITPEDALQILVNNQNNRPLTARLIESIADDIRRDKWQVNGSTIRIDKNGNLLDGQHRLNAIEAAGKAVQTFVIRGLEPECISTIDTNCRSRKNSDIFGIEGETNVLTLSTALNWLCRYDLAALASKEPYAISYQRDALKKHPGIRHSVSRITSTKTKLIPAGPAAFLHYQFSLKDPDLADVWMQGLANGYDAEKYPNFALLFQKLLKNFSDRMKIDRNELVILVVKAWNATRKGAKMKVLRFEAAEATPKIN